MNFKHRQEPESLEINLIPLIDVLLVILIFLAAATSFTQQRQLQVDLPHAQADTLEQVPALELAINRDGLYALDGHYIEAGSDEQLATALRQAASGNPGQALRIDADGQASHASVVRALEAARLAEISKVHFLTQARP